ncbi:hypothetical protein WN943_007630 [Citrus x changshan-huyou]
MAKNNNTIRASRFSCSVIAALLVLGPYSNVGLGSVIAALLDLGPYSNVGSGSIIAVTAGPWALFECWIR